MYLYKRGDKFICKLHIGSEKLIIISDKRISIKEALKEFMCFFPDTTWKLNKGE